MVTAYYDSPIGLIEIAAYKGKIIYIGFVNKITLYFDGEVFPLMVDIIKQLDEYFTGERRVFDLDIELIGTDFQCLVWREVMKIPCGTTISYSQLAENIGKPNAVRAVATAVGANKLAIIIPCHRVVGKNGEIAGYRWGVDRKRFLLGYERSNICKM